MRHIGSWSYPYVPAVVNYWLIINSLMEQSPYWEAMICWASQQTYRVLWNQKVHYRVHNSPTLSQINLVHVFTLYVEDPL